MNYKKIDPLEVQKRISEGRKHLNFMVSLYRDQLRRGKHFLHEHPQTAYSWQEVAIKALSRDSHVHVVTGDQCMYGLLTPDDKGNPVPARKATTFMTSSRQMADLLGPRCDGSHTHQPLVSGRCAAAAFYPKKLIQTILQGIRNTKDAEAAMAENAREHRELVQRISDSAGKLTNEDMKVHQSKVTKTNGGVINVTYSPENFRSKYLDEYTGESLEPELISTAIREELDYFNSKVWQIEQKSEMLKKKDYVFVRSRWVLCNKGDNKVPDMRARLVACEVNKGDRHDAFYASTPPLEAKKVLFSRLAQERYRNGEPLRLDFLDVKKAYFNGIPKRDVYMQLPREMGLPSHFVARQVRCVYGTRDAGAIWEDTYREALESIGFRSGVASPCCFFHPERNLSTVVHGDDITTLGLDGDLDWFREALGNSFELKVRGRVGEGLDGSNDMRILNRIVEMKPDGITYEADPRHVEIMLNSMGLTEANSVMTPGVKEGVTDYSAQKLNEPDGCPKVVEEDTEVDDAPAINSLSGRKTLSQTGRKTLSHTRGMHSEDDFHDQKMNLDKKSVDLSGYLHSKN